MKITRLGTQLEIDPPPQRPITDALRSNSHPGRVQVRIFTDQGLVGTSTVGFASIRGANETLQFMLDQEVAPLIEGKDPLKTQAIQSRLRKALEEQALHGMTRYCMTAVDVALWDIVGQAAGMPVHRLLGQAHDRIPTYAMVGWMQWNRDELSRSCAEAASQGFRAVKVKVGAPSLDTDVDRIEVVRSELGKDFRIMVDANQTLSTFEALRRGRVYEELGVFWFEEPLPAHDYAAYATLAGGLDIPIATGENLYGKEEFRELMERGGIDIVQGDVPRLGGVAESHAAGILASCYGLPFCTHGRSLVKLNILCALPNAMYIESGMLNEEWLEHFEDGCILAPEGAGFSW